MGYPINGGWTSATVGRRDRGTGEPGRRLLRLGHGARSDPAGGVAPDRCMREPCLLPQLRLTLLVVRAGSLPSRGTVRGRAPRAALDVKRGGVMGMVAGRRLLLLAATVAGVAGCAGTAHRDGPRDPAGMPPAADP